VIGCFECKHVFTLLSLRYPFFITLEKRDPAFADSLAGACESAQHDHGLPEATNWHHFEPRRPEGYEEADWRIGCPMLANKEEKM
jgi:hypothetical protein